MKKKIVLNPTSTAQWHDLILAAENKTKIFLRENLESYLVFLLMRFTKNPEIISSIIATEWLESLNHVGNIKQNSLQNVGDKCLIFTGLFPGLAKKRRVPIEYYINLGRNAYHILADINNNFADLDKEFVRLMDILQTTRNLYSSNFYSDNDKIIHVDFSKPRF